MNNRRTQWLHPAGGNAIWTGTITVQNVPAGATVWVNIHLDYAAKGDNVSTLNPSPMSKPVTYRPFSSDITMRSGSLVVGTSHSETSVIGRGKKVTMAYGIVKDSTAMRSEKVWVRLTQGTCRLPPRPAWTASTSSMTARAAIANDGAAGACFNGTGHHPGHVELSNGNGVSTTIRILGEGSTPLRGMPNPDLADRHLVRA